jgi:hypothetical protein
LKNRVTYRLIAPRFNLILLSETDTCLIYGATFTGYRVDLKPHASKILSSLLASSLKPTQKAIPTLLIPSLLQSSTTSLTLGQSPYPSFSIRVE